MDGNTISLDALSSDTIGQVNEKIQKSQGSLPERHHLFYINKMLLDEKTISDYDIKNNDTLKMSRLSPGEIITKIFLTISLKKTGRQT